ncbi:MAG: hypothetical protein GY731_00310 [Gammaproteobacteria bacterium]|nr:hypothetical protein [Gammaproteobacteria bacterium]
MSQEPKTVSFTPVRVVTADTHSALRIQLPNGVAIEIFSPVAEPVLLGVLRTAGQLP